jgi:hypothetical protein
VVEESRSEICFKTGMTGFHITLFFFFLNKMVIEDSQGKKDLQKLAKQLDSHFGCLEQKQENLFQKKCFEIQEVKSFQKYYPLLGIAMPNTEALQARLKQAIENSRKKGYHGNDDNMNKVPSLEDQSKEILDDKVKVFEFWLEESKEWLSSDSPKWQAAVLEKFSWIR